MSDAWLRATTGTRAPRRAALMSRSARPVAMAYRNICPHFYFARCAVS